MINCRAIVLEETPDRTRRLAEHMRGIGVYWTPFQGINAAVWGLATTFPYEVGAPGSGYIMQPKHVGLHLSHYLLWRVFAESSSNVITVMEDDCQLVEGWRDGYHKAMAAMPHDWDMIFLGSGNAEDKPKTQIKDNVWDVRYPMCTHCYMINRSALPVLLSTQRKSWAPIDLALIFRSFPQLKVYTVLPRIAVQHGQEIAP